MKKVALITFHTPKNYGAVLQAYSLMTYLRTLVEDVKIIDYNTPHLRSIYPLYTRPHTAKQAVGFALNLPYLGKKKCKYAKFERFVSENLELTRRFESYEDLMKSPPDADFYITGSDQVFNPNRIEEERKAFYLSFGSEDTKRIAYAASFGVRSVPEDKRKEISEYLSIFSTISVREENGVSIVENLAGRIASEVLDPVFLNNKEFWRLVAEAYPVGNKPYLLYYRLMSSKQSDDCVRRIAHEKKLRLVVVTEDYLKWRADKILRDVGPKELLYLIDRAEYVATDSFHGVAFSIIFEKQFIFSDYQPELAERALNLLKKVDADCCAGLNGNQGNSLLNYEKVNQNLDGLISSSKQFLKDALSY